MALSSLSEKSVCWKPKEDEQSSSRSWQLSTTCAPNDDQYLSEKAPLFPRLPHVLRQSMVSLPASPAARCSNRRGVNAPQACRRACTASTSSNQRRLNPTPNKTPLPPLTRCEQQPPAGRIYMVSPSTILEWCRQEPCLSKRLQEQVYSYIFT